ncbi:MAG: CDP-diacylglycerol--glycerol-3-phosphate 3-phosphatidyltransferase [Actinomycetota bacterium]|nr:CDP-diacylglycerol--glycerol-3-phosphate 3-phosphatidyltransferase [Actinomycetota bacterium]
MNLPNAITLARILMVPAFIVLGYGDSDALAYAAFLVFFVASVSDLVDGYLARKNGSISKTGEFLDPLADKLLIGSALIVLVATRDFPLWAAIVIGVREVAVQLLRTRVVSTGGRLPASRGAKAKTVVQLCMVSWWVLPSDSRNFMHWGWLFLALAVTLYTGASYFAAARAPAAEVAT